MNYYDFALKDLECAKVLFTNSNEYDNILVHCRQYVEKSLKHLLYIKTGEIINTCKLTIICSKINEKELDDYKLFLGEIQDYNSRRMYPHEGYIERNQTYCELYFTETLKFQRTIEKLFN